MIGDPPVTLPDVALWSIPVFVGAMVLEAVAARGSYEARDTGANIGVWLGNLVAKALTGVIAFNAFWWAFNLRLWDIPWAWWSLPLCFLGEDLAFYWFHRISHERRWFWATHVVHHSSQKLNFSTALRQSWTGVIGLSFIFWLPLMLIGFPPAMVFFFTACSLIYQFWLHTETVPKLGPLEWVFNTPSHHRVHHATNAHYLDANYGGVLIIWDRLFGSFVEEDAATKPTYGIVADIATFNPLRVAFHEWIAMFADVLRAKSLRDAFLYVFGPPGWSPDGSRQTTRDIKQLAAAHRVAAE